MFLLQLSGFPGSGKSTLAKHVSDLTNATVLDRDLIKAKMLETGLNNDDASSLSYDLLYELVDIYLSKKQSVIIDTPCYYMNIIKTGQSLAENHNCLYRYIECKVDDFKIIEHRLRTRERLISQIKKKKKEHFDKHREHICYPDSSYLILDTSQAINNYDHVMSYLKGESDDI